MKIKGVLATSIEVGVEYWCDGVKWIGIESGAWADRVYLQEIEGIRVKAPSRNEYAIGKPYFIGYRKRKDKTNHNWAWSICKRIYRAL